MIDVRAALGAVSAWRILKYHPCYREAWQAVADRIACPEGAPIPIRRQTEADLEAAPWGLLAWQDPFAEGGPASPFWADAPMPEGIPGRRETPSFAALVRSRGGAVSGLLLLDGALILKVERQGAAGQVRIEDGAAFDVNKTGQDVPNVLMTDNPLCGLFLALPARGMKADGRPPDGSSHAHRRTRPDDSPEHECARLARRQAVPRHRSRACGAQLPRFETQSRRERPRIESNPGKETARMPSTASSAPGILRSASISRSRSRRAGAGAFIAVPPHRP